VFASGASRLFGGIGADLRRPSHSRALTREASRRALRVTENRPPSIRGRDVSEAINSLRHPLRRLPVYPAFLPASLIHRKAVEEPGASRSLERILAAAAAGRVG
jgi:hypothetical protein